MNKHKFLKLPGVAFSLLLISINGFAQSDLRKTEIGFLLTTIDLNKSVGEKPLGVGGRFTYNANDYIAFDSEISYFPQNPSGDFGETAVLAGVRAGIRTDKIGVFAKARPGLIRFGGDSFKVYNGAARNNFAVDVGGVLEFYPNKRVIIRVDAGDTIIPFRNDGVRTGASIIPGTPGTTHNFQGSFGIGFRF